MQNEMFFGLVIGAVFNQYTLGVWRFEQAFALKPVERRREYASWVAANAVACCFAVIIVEVLQWAAPIVEWPLGIMSNVLKRAAQSSAHVAIGAILMACVYGLGYIFVDLWQTRKHTR